MKTRIAAAFLSCLFGLSAYAYVQPLHRKISAYAFDHAMSQTDVLKRYGWESMTLTLRKEMENGAEDQDDGINSLNHFYDPQNYIGLTEPALLGGIPFCKSIGQPAHDWALRSPLEGNGNTRSLEDAHEYLNRALSAPTEAERKKSARELFATLGHIAHLLQDMGQPDHTRNDQHLSLFGFEFSGDIAAGLYEKWTAEHLLASAPLADGTSPSALFTNPVYPEGIISYWAYFQWMSRYSSLHFLTQDTNYGSMPFCSPHVEPDIRRATPRVRTRTVSAWDDDAATMTLVTFDENVYSLPLTRTSPGSIDVDEFHTVESVLDYEAGAFGKRVFSLSDESWLSRAKHLIPRTVGVSAAFLKSFFRGPLYATWVPNDTDDSLTALVKSSDTNYDNSYAYLFQNDGSKLNMVWHPASPGYAFSRFVYGGPTEIPTRLPYLIDGQPFYRRETRVVVRGDRYISGEPRESRAITGVVIPARNELKVIIEYDSTFVHDNLYLNVWPVAGTDVNDFPVARGFTTSSSHGNGPFTRLKKRPFNGVIEGSIGLADEHEVRVIVIIDPTLAWPTTQWPTPARLRVYRNGTLQFDRQWPFGPTQSILSVELSVKGTGAVTVIDE